MNTSIQRESVLEAVRQSQTKIIEELNRKLREKQREMAECEAPLSDDPENPKSACVEEIRRIEKKIKGAQKCLDTLKELPESDPDGGVNIGSIVTLRDTGGRDNTYIIIPKSKECACCALSTDRQTIICASVKAPVFAAIMDKRPGTRVNYRGIDYEIVSVQ